MNFCFSYHFGIVAPFKAISTCSFKCACIVLLGALICLPKPSHAMDLSISNGIVRLSGTIGTTAGIDFRTFVRNAGEQKIVAVQLDSLGGSISDAFDIARLIRKNGYSTVVDAKSGRCYSACTLLFISGIRRAYVNAAGIRDGLARSLNQPGLGFHGANALFMGSRSAAGYGTSLMIGGFYEFGVSEAKELILKADYNQMYLVSPETAVRMGVATQLTALNLRVPGT